MLPIAGPGHMCRRVSSATAGVHRAEDDACCTGERGVGCCANVSVTLAAFAKAMAAGGSRQQAWAAVAALAVLAACSAAGSAYGQVLGVDVTNSTLVFTSEGFAQALQSSNIHTILISCECTSEPAPSLCRPHAAGCRVCTQPADCSVHAGPAALLSAGSLQWQQRSCLRRSLRLVHACN
jgi:hypothetical protein